MEKTIVIYFSATGATKRMAEKIAATIGADIFEIEPAIKYTDDDLKWPSRSNRSFLEMKNRAYRPPVSNRLENIDDYDRIILGFPVWYFTAPTVVNTFIEENDFTGKDVYVFVTSGVTNADKSLKDLRKLYPNVNFVKGKRFNGSFYAKEILEWLDTYMV